MELMFKIYLAIGHKQLEDFIQNNKGLIERKLNEEVEFVGVAVYREAIIQGIKEYHPDVVIIREGIQGSLSLTDLVYQIQIISPSTRIIFIAGDRKPGDAFLATLVQYGVYDILVGNKVNVKDILKRIVSPNKMVDVIAFMPKIKITEDGKQLYDAPDVGLINPMLEDNYGEPAVKPLTDLSTIKEDEPVQPTLQEEEDEPIEVEEEEPIQEEIPTPPPTVEKKKGGLFGRKQKEEVSKPPVQEPVPAPLPPVVDEPKPLPPVMEEPKVEPQPLPPVQQLPPIQQPTQNRFNLNTEKPPVQEPYNQNRINLDMNKPPVQEPEPYNQGSYVPPVQQMPPIQEPYGNQGQHGYNNQGPQIPVMPPVQPEPKETQFNPYQPQQNPYINQPPIQQPSQPFNGYGNQGGYGNFNPYERPGNMYPQNNMPQTNNQPKKGGLFGKKSPQKTIQQQVITFVGARSGCGTSQIAFNTAVLLAEQGFKTLYMDLNSKDPSIDAILTYGLTDVGVDTMLKDMAVGNYTNIAIAINSAAKELSSNNERVNERKAYSKLPSKLEFTCFSEAALKKREPLSYDVNLLKDLIIFLQMNFGYDMIILDASSDLYDDMTKITMLYSNKLFFVLTQDGVDFIILGRAIKCANLSNINYKDKSYFICNKFVNNKDNSAANLQNMLENAFGKTDIQLVTIPNVHNEIISANATMAALIQMSKDKTLKKGFQDIVNIISN